MGESLFVQSTDGENVPLLIDDEDILVFVEDLVRAFVVVFHGSIILLLKPLFFECDVFLDLESAPCVKFSSMENTSLSNLPEGISCRIYDGEKLVYESSYKGVKPLWVLLASGQNVAGDLIVDRVSGKAAAFFYLKLGIKEVHTDVLSEEALKLLQSHGIPVTYERLVPHVLNSDKSDVCPLEKASEPLSNIDDGVAAVLQGVEELRRKKRLADLRALFPEVQSNFGFGCMRLPMKGDLVDLVEFKRMVEHFLEAGFTYFDTAHGYLNGESEKAIKEALTSRYPRNAYTLTDKLTGNFFKKEEDIRPLFESQLKACGVDYFDFYLMHAQTANSYAHFQECHAYEVAQELKKEGKVHHVGFSFHDTPELLEKILTDHPEVELVQLQFNYADYENPAVNSKACYDVCVKHHKPVVVMEPVKGGRLVNLPPEALAILNERKAGSPAIYAIRFAASFDNVLMVLSGMSNLEQMQDNLSFMKDFKPLDKEEKEALSRVNQELKKYDLIPCTACHYCTAGCPKKIAIPDLFACYNQKAVFKDWNSNWYYTIHTAKAGKASDCIKCGQCEKVCPQHLSIRALLVQVKNEFEK